MFDRQGYGRACSDGVVKRYVLGRGLVDGFVVLERCVHGIRIGVA